MLVKIKEILTKMYFHMPSELSVPIYTTFTQHTDFFICSNLVPLRGTQTINLRSFHSVFIPRNSK